jgi:hypothetical protein
MQLWPHYSTRASRHDVPEVSGVVSDFFSAAAFHALQVPVLSRIDDACPKLGF